jgi:bifunctional non-homologous end joining protein LigD
MHLGSEAAVRRKMAEAPVAYVLFDVLHLDGRSLMDRPWEERRAALDELGLEGSHWRTPRAHRGDGADFVAATKAQGLEGVVAKKVDCPYEPGRRTGAWVKVKHVAQQELVIGGWLPGEGRRRDTIGALLLGYHDPDGELRYAGRVGSGFTETELRRLGRLLKPLEREATPFDGGRPPKGAVWVEPCLVAEVAYTEWTSAGMIRHPVYKGVRDDVDPDRVMREGSEPEAEPEVEAEAAVEPAPGGANAVGGGAGGASRVNVEGRELSLSNLGKVLYPAAGFTKAQVVDYYARIAPALLPHLAGRALTLKRYPNGVEGKFFYEKNSPGHRPDWVRTQEIGGVNYTVIDGLPALVWVANLASLELHTSLSRAAKPEEPTQLVFDLDPGAPADIVTCCEVGLLIRELLAGLGLESWAKTSGSKGLQVYAPLNTPGVTYDQTKGLARAIAQLLERRHPKLVVSRMAKELRGGKILVDWSQNDPHKTTVCVYSLRARERPTVSAPVGWDEVTECHDHADPDLLVFEAGDVLERFADGGDRFAPVAELAQDLPELSGL